MEAASGNTVFHYFCPACGSPLGMRSGAFPEMRGVRASSLDDASGLEPLANLWTRNQYPWEHIDPTLPAMETSPTKETFPSFFEDVLRQAEARRK